MFHPRKEECRWIKQVLAACEDTDFAPLLVMRGNGTDIYAAAPLRVVEKYIPRGRTAPLLYFNVSMLEREWLMLPFARFTAEMRRRIQDRQERGIK